MEWWKWVLAALLLVAAAWGIRMLAVRQRRIDQRRSAIKVTPLPEESVSDRPSVWVIFNPAKADDITALKSEVSAQAREHGFADPHWLETTEDDPGTGQAVQAADAGAALVIAAGGDGTIRAVAAGLAHTGVRMGIVPMGTGNLLARNLRVPMNILRAAEVAFMPTHIAMDIGWLRVEDDGFQGDLMPEGALVVAARRRLAENGPKNTQPEQASENKEGPQLEAGTESAGACPNAETPLSERGTAPTGAWSPKDTVKQDLIRSDEFCYVVIAGLGFDGVTMANTDPDLKKRVGWIAYVVAALKALNVKRMRAHLRLQNAVSLPKQSAISIPGTIGHVALVEGERFPVNPWEQLARKSKDFEARARLGQSGSLGDSSQVGENASEVSALPGTETPGTSASLVSALPGTTAPGISAPESSESRSSVPEPSMPAHTSVHDDEVIHAHAKTILFANCGELPYIVLAPDAQVDDGLLDIIAVDTRGGLVGWADLASQIIGQGTGIPAGRLLGTGKIAFRQAQGASVHVKEPQVVQVDGDALGKARRVITRVDAAAVEVAVSE